MKHQLTKKPIFLAVIPARSGSKGIPNKNIRNFCGKPLMAYAIEQARKCKKISCVIVSTDSKKYAAIAKKYGADVPFLRPKELAGDKSPIFDTIKHLILTLNNTQATFYIPDYIV